MNAQLPLGLRLPASARFDNFVSGANAEVLAAVSQLAQDSSTAVLFLAGPAGTGKTHLLQACCRAVQESGQQAAYLPLRDWADLAPAALDGLEHFSLIAIDDVETVAGHPAWEEALFHLYNRLRAAGGRLLGAALEPPDRLPLQLPDLRSRLAWGPVYALHPPDDATRLRILGARAQDRGLELPEETGRYLLRRCPRDLPALMDILDRLDQAALAAQRRLTIPFVKQVVAGD